METQVIPCFISVREQEALLEWANNAKLYVRNQPDKLLERPQNEHKLPTTGERKSHFIGDDECKCGKVLQGPPEFYTAQRRATERFDLEDKMPEIMGREGKVIIHEEDSETPAHIDYFRHMGPGFTRATLIVQAPKAGGVLSVGGKDLLLPERALAIYDASKWHAVSLVEEGRRVAYVFGWKDQVGSAADLVRDRVREYGRQRL